MKKINKTLLAGLIASGVCGVGAIDSAQAENVRKITVLDDSNLTPMVTRVYDLKHAKAADLTPFVQGAVKSMRSHGKVDRLNFKANGTQHLVVTMDADYTDQIDDLIKKLDRPGLIGTGIHNFSYNFRNRTAYGIFNKPGDAGTDAKRVVDLFKTNDATYHQFDSDTVLWKDSLSDGLGAAKWFEALDVPIPAAEFEFTVYEVSEDDIKDIGMDYNDWFTKVKAGGGLFDRVWTFDSGAQAGKTRWFEQSSSGGAPVKLNDFDLRIDGSFLRMLQNKGKARIVHTAKLVMKNPTPNVVKNDGDNADSGGADPDENQLYKGTETDAVISLGSDFTITIRRDKTLIFCGAEQVNLGYEVEYSAGHSAGANSFYAKVDRVKIGYGDENIITSLVNQHEVTQYVGMPVLGEIPVIKYLVGTEATSTQNTKLFVTCKVTDVTPQSNMNDEALSIMDDVTASVK